MSIVSCKTLTVVLGAFTAAMAAQANGPEAVPSTAFAVPAAIIENTGQWDTPARFVGRYGPLMARFEPHAIVLQIDSQGPDDRVTTGVVRLVFEDALSGAQIEGEERLAGRYSYFIGPDATRWRTDVPSYRRVIYRGLYEGIDLRVREAGGQLEYDLLLAPGADPERFVVRVEGIEGLDIDAEGALVMDTALGRIRQMPPTTWSELPDGGRRAVESRFCLIDDTRYGFAVAAPALEGTLVIDPRIEWSTFLGGSSSDWVAWPNGLHLAASGKVLVAGATWSSNFPATAGAYDTTYNNNRDAFVAVLDPSVAGVPQLEYCTYLGGGFTDGAWSVREGALGIVVAGTTQSFNFPTTAGAYDETYNGGFDAWIAIIDPTQAGAAQLVYSTFLGTATGEGLQDILVEPAGTILVLGNTDALDFPTTVGAYNTTYNGGSADAFITRLDPNAEGPLQLAESTLFGTFGFDVMRNIAVDAGGNIVVAGEIRGSDFPATPGAWDNTYTGGFSDGAIAKFDPTLGTLLAATYFGGAGFENGNAMALEASGIVTVAGWTDSFDLPFTIDAYDTTINGGLDVYVARLDANLTTVLACTYIGGSLDDGANGVAVDSAGNVTVAGVANSMNYPTTPGAASETHNGGTTDALVSRFDANLSTLRYSTYLGGTNNSDFGYVVEDDESGTVTVAGLTTSSSFPTTSDAFDTSHNGGNDGYITKLKYCPWDCDGSNDGEVGILDFLTVLGQWGMVGSSCDFDSDGLNINDFLEVLGRWGLCP